MRISDWSSDVCSSDLRHKLLLRDYQSIARSVDTFHQWVWYRAHNLAQEGGEFLPRFPASFSRPLNSLPGRRHYFRRQFRRQFRRLTFPLAYWYREIRRTLFGPLTKLLIFLTHVLTYQQVFSVDKLSTLCIFFEIFQHCCFGFREVFKNT